MDSLSSLFHFIRRFWNHILICVSVRSKLDAISIRRVLVKYLLKWNSFSNSTSCRCVNVNLFLLLCVVSARFFSLFVSSLSDPLDAIDVEKTKKTFNTPKISSPKVTLYIGVTTILQKCRSFWNHWGINFHQTANHRVLIQILFSFSFCLKLLRLTYHKQRLSNADSKDFSNFYFLWLLLIASQGKTRWYGHARKWTL